MADTLRIKRNKGNVSDDSAASYRSGDHMILNTFDKDCQTFMNIKRHVQKIQDLSEQLGGRGDSDLIGHIMNSLDVALPIILQGIEDKARKTGAFRRLAKEKDKRKKTKPRN